MFTGNRGCLVGGDGQVVRHHRGSLWITCLLAYRGWQNPLAQPGRWTPLFFLDDAVALAAGHRPCGLCRRDDYLAYRDSVAPSLRATDLNRLLALERLRRGGGLERARDRKTWSAPLDQVPDGTVVLDDGPRLVLGDRTFAFGFDGWHGAQPRESRVVDVLTPPTSVTALRNGFTPTLHPTTGRQ